MRFNAYRNTGHIFQLKEEKYDDPWYDPIRRKYKSNHCKLLHIVEQRHY